jgi:membrane-associated phospholipid phosphatase
MSGNNGNNGNTGNNGNNGNNGNAGRAGGGWFFADRADLPFVATPSSDGFNPIAHRNFRLPATGAFGRRWAAEWRSWQILSDFTDTVAWRNRQREAGKGAAAPGGLTLASWQARLTANGTSLEDAVHGEIDDLIRMAEDERGDALGEILSQSDEFLSWFMGLLCATPGSHPATFALGQSASAVATLGVQHFKRLDDRRRPSQLCPALRPPIEVPGHAAYPSGHATQSFLIARCLAAAVAGGPSALASEALDALANRIARNREIAGVHYPSDTAAGRDLAAQLFAALDGVATFKAQLAAATAEWA